MMHEPNPLEIALIAGWAGFAFGGVIAFLICAGNWRRGVTEGYGYARDLFMGDGQGRQFKDAEKYLRETMAQEWTELAGEE